MSTVDFAGQVFVVDDDEGMAELYDSLLASVALPHRRFASGEQFLAAWQSDWWGALVLDLRMPGMGGMAVLRALTEKEALLAVIVITGHGEIRSAVEAMQHGAINYLEKPFSNEEFFTSVQRAIQASRARYAAYVRKQDLLGRYALLSPRERKVAGLVARGLTSKEIGAELDISVRTVEVHRAHVLQQLACDGSIELAKLMLEIERVLPGKEF